MEARLSREEEQRLARLLPDPAARARLVESQIELVHRAVRRFRRNPVLHDEALSCCMARLLHAVDLFNPELGFRLVTYASHWVQQGVQEAVERCRVIHVPERVRREGVTALVTPLDEWDVPDDSLRPDEALMVAEQAELERRALRRAWKALAPWQVEVIERRMRGETLEEIGERRGITRQAVHVAEAKAICQLRERAQRELVGLRGCTIRGRATRALPRP